jgi:hypothetical protein
MLSVEWALAGAGYGIIGVIVALLHLNNAGSRGPRTGGYVKPHISEVVAAGALWPVLFTFTVVFGVSRLSLRLIKVGPQLQREAKVAFQEAKGKAVVVSDQVDYH